MKDEGGRMMVENHLCKCEKHDFASGCFRSVFGGVGIDLLITAYRTDRGTPAKTNVEFS
jgi:hypothetical protein